MKRGLPIQRRTMFALQDREMGLCQGRFPGCANEGHHAHHMKYRSRGGSNSLENLALLCFPCHEKVHANYEGTERLRTHGWQTEGRTEADA